MIRIFAISGNLVIDSEGHYPISLFRFIIDANRLTIENVFIEERGEPFKVLYQVDTNLIRDQYGASFADDAALQSYLDNIWNNSTYSTFTDAFGVNI